MVYSCLFDTRKTISLHLISVYSQDPGDSGTREMGFLPIFASLILFVLLFLPSLQYHVPAADEDPVAIREREALEIVIGGGGGYGYGAPEPSVGCPLPPPPPEPECPPPPPTPLPPPPPPPPPPVPVPSPPPPKPNPPPPPPKPKPPPPPPKPKPPPPPPPFGPYESELLAKVAPVIQAFKKKIKDDPKGYKKTWVGTNICGYKGFICDKQPDAKKKAVAGVDFNGAMFAGYNDHLPLDGFLDKLDDVAIFHANSNNFTGGIPKDITKFKFLYELDFSNNRLTGGFPTEVFGVKGLSFLDIRFNSFTGAVPPQIFDMKLDILFINDNKFMQNLPDNLGDTTALYITFARNKFTGRIPSSIGRAPYLLEILFLDNAFTGCLPYEIGNLKNLTVLDVGRNQLTGPIPYSFGCLEKMQLLNFASNQFYGPVPEIVCKLPKLTNLSLSNNYFTQVGPECRKLIKKKVLDVRMNCILDLPSQRSKAECAAFFSKPRFCQNESKMKWIPCKKTGYNANSEQKFNQESAAAPPPLTYGALRPHRL